MDRNELAARFAVAQYGDGREWIGTVSEVARHAVEMADALLHALTPTPAPVAPPAGKYVPAVGDIVIGLFGDDGLARVDSVDPTRWSALCDGTWRSGFRFGVTSTARLATDAEKRAAGLAVPPPAPTPAPEAKCEMCGGPHVRDVFHAADLQSPAPEAKRPAPRPPPVAGSDERPEVVCLCGSTRFKDAFLAETKRLTLAGKIVLSVGCFPHTDDGASPEAALGEDVKRRLDALHLRKIDLAGSVHVVNVGGYIGSSAKREIQYARDHGKPVTWMEEPSATTRPVRP